MRSQLWILAQAQVLDLLFSEQHTDGSLTTSPKRFEHSLDRISPPPDAAASLENVTLRLIVPAANAAIPGRWRFLVSLLDGEAWADKGRKALELLTLDLSHLTGAAVAQIVGSTVVEERLPEAGRWAAARVIAASPGVRAIAELLLTDGTLLFEEPKRYVRLAPHLLKDSLVLAPAPLVAAVLVGGAFVRGTTIDEIWKELSVGPGTKRGLLGKLSEALAGTGSGGRNGSAVGPLGVVDTARRIQELAGLADGALAFSDRGRQLWSRLRKAMA
jgi:hypothetical protein